MQDFSWSCSNVASCWLTLVTASYLTLFLLVGFSLGVLVAYAANHNISTQIKSTRRLINTNMRDLKTFANNTPAVHTHTHAYANRWFKVKQWYLIRVFLLLQQIDYLTAQYTTAKNKVLSDLDSKFMNVSLISLPVTVVIIIWLVFDPRQTSDLCWEPESTVIWRRRWFLHWMLPCRWQKVSVWP